MAGSWLGNATSLRPVIRARLGTEAEIVTLPVEVAPSEPCEAADAEPAERPLTSASPIMATRLPFTSLIACLVTVVVPIQVAYA